jgi:hypothetical protein
MNANTTDLNKRFTQTANLQSRRIDNTRKAILKLIEALGESLTEKQQWEIKTLLGRG